MSAAPLSAGVLLDAFVAASTLDARVALLSQAAGRRLTSAECVSLWIDILQRLSGRLEPLELRRLTRQLIALAPYQPIASSLYEATLRGVPQPLPEGSVVAMVVSCEPYLNKAIALHHALEQAGQRAYVVTADARRPGPTLEGGRFVVETADTYEALVDKVLLGIDAIVGRHGAVAIAKIDDDCALGPGFDPAALTALAARAQYAGHPVGAQECDRCWHVGKTSREVPVYGKRVHGAWAMGGAYLLGAESVRAIHREHAFFPGEFAGEIYEDKAIGDFLRRRGVLLENAPPHSLGIMVDFSERTTAAPRREAVPA